jgi:hypothetical protein
MTRGQVSARAPAGRKAPAPRRARNVGPDLARALQESLPTGSHVVVQWRDARNQQVCSAVPGVPETLFARAAELFDGGALSRAGSGVDDAWEGADGRVSLAAILAEPLPATSARRRGSSRWKSPSGCSRRCSRSPTCPGRRWN